MKKLLLMGGSAYVNHIIDYCKRNKISLIGVGNDKSAKHMLLANQSFNIDTSNIDAVVSLCKKHGINGVFVGASEVNIENALKVTELANLPFYCTKEQWSIIANKKNFKEELKKHGLPTIPDVEKNELLEGKQDKFPVLVKPADQSSSKGVYICHNREEFLRYYESAASLSKSKKVLIEKFITNAKEVFFNFTFVNGKLKISTAYTRYMNDDLQGINPLPILNLYPTKHLPEFEEKYLKRFEELFTSIGYQNGPAHVEAFYQEEVGFMFFEAGIRLGGSQSYIFTNHLHSFNGIEYFLELNFGKKPSMKVKENPYFEQACTNLYVSLKPGVISKLEGVSEIEKMQSVLNITQIKFVGDSIPFDGSLEHVGLRIHLCSKNIDILSSDIEKLFDKLTILDQEGNDMVLERMKHKKVKQLFDSETLL